MPTPVRITAQSLSIVCNVSGIFPSLLRHPVSTTQPAPPHELFGVRCADGQQPLADRYRFQRGHTMLDVHTWIVTGDRGMIHRAFPFAHTENH